MAFHESRIPRRIFADERRRRIVIDRARQAAARWGCRGRIQFVPIDPERYPGRHADNIVMRVWP